MATEKRRHRAWKKIMIYSYDLFAQKSNLQFNQPVDPLLTLGTVRRVPRIDNTDERQTATAGQHWTGVHPLKHRLSSLLSDLPCSN